MAPMHAALRRVDISARGSSPETTEPNDQARLAESNPCDWQGYGIRTIRITFSRTTQTSEDGPAPNRVSRILDSSGC